MVLEITGDQALVLFEWLSRLDDLDAFPCQHDAEKQVLWILQGQLEKELVEPFSPDYQELVEKARLRILSGLEV